jgi:hypothetical protein
MVIRTIEEISDKLERLQKEVQRLKDVNEIQNFMSRYNLCHEMQLDYKFPETMYAQKTPGVSAEIAQAGVYLGQEGIRKMYSPMPGSIPGPSKGIMFTHPLTTPIIEVAGDGKTAKGAWVSPCWEAKMDSVTKLLTSFCTYIKYGCDFVKEDGKWKMWHYHVYRVFTTPWNVPFTEEWEKNVRDKVARFGYERKPDMSTTTDNPYSKDTVREMLPIPPEPYETFSETFSYGPTEKH